MIKKIERKNIKNPISLRVKPSKVIIVSAFVFLNLILLFFLLNVNSSQFFLEILDLSKEGIKLLGGEEVPGGGTPGILIIIRNIFGNS